MNNENNKFDNFSNSNNGNTTITSVPPKQSYKSNRFFIAIIAVIIIIIIYGVYNIYSNRSKMQEQPRQKQSNVPEDMIFSKGFTNTGFEWPIRTQQIEDLKKNPLTKIREAYCSRVGYKYADFGGDCFLFQYYDSYNIYEDKEEKFKVYYPTLWQKDLEPTNYGFTSNQKISLKRQGASCAIVYGTINENEILSYNNASTTKTNFDNQTSDFINTDNKRLNKISLPFKREISNEEKAAGYTNTNLIAIPQFPYTESKFGFLLTSGEKQPLVEACVQEFNEILNSRAINYPTSKLTPDSNGNLLLRDISSFFEIYTKIPKKITLLFENYSTGKYESIVSEAFQDIQNIYPFLNKGKLYFMEGPIDNSIIKTVDIFTGENKKIPLQYDTTKPIHSFFIKNDILYYLTGEFCNTYLASCKNMSLKSYNLTSGINETLVNNSKSRNINGFSANGNLILSWSDGDAGCSFGSYESYSFSNKILKNLGSYSHCEGDTNDSQNKFKNLITGSGSFNHLIIKNGNIFSPSIGTADIYYPNVIEIRTNTAEYPLYK